MIADSIGVAMLATVAAIPLGCIKTALAVRAEPQPFIAVCGTYAVLASGSEPGPAPVQPDGCAAGCKCGGTGKEKSGDGLALVGCRCPDTCKCKGAVQHPPATISSKPSTCTSGSCKVIRR